jgi:cation:H+ antiporter
LHNGAQKPAHSAIGLALLLFVVPLYHSSPWAALWTVPAILIASLLITWGAESAQFFVAQGFALAILALMQTLPEFAVEAVLAWRQQTVRTGHHLRSIQLSPHHSVEVIGLLFPLLYAVAIWYKASLHVYDAVVLVALYAAYLWLLTKLPPEEREGIEELETIPRSIVLAPRRWRMLAIAGCFFAGGLLIYFTAEPFLGSLVAIAGAIGIPTFIVIQWLAPVISEFPELASTFYFARQEKNASTAIMNIASSNINQWTLLMAMLPVVFSLSRGTVSSFSLDPEQRLELLLTIGQSFVAMIFLVNMRIEWWEALSMFLLFAAQFVLPALFGDQVKIWITAAFFIWTAAVVLEIVLRRRVPNALARFFETWRAHISS